MLPPHPILYRPSSSPQGPLKPLTTSMSFLQVPACYSSSLSRGMPRLKWWLSSPHAALRNVCETAISGGLLLGLCKRVRAREGSNTVSEEIVMTNLGAAFQLPHMHKARGPQLPRRQCHLLKHASTGPFCFLNLCKHLPGISSMTQSTCDHVWLGNIIKVFQGNFPNGKYLNVLFFWHMLLTSQ